MAGWYSADIYVLWWFAAQIEGAEFDEYALASGRQKGIQALAALVVGVHQLGRVEGAVARATAPAHERDVALCNITFSI